MHAKTVNKVKTVKRLAILIVVLSLVGGTSVFTQQFQLQRLGQKELKKAKLALKKGDFVNAERLFEEYLQVFPGEIDVQIEFVDAYLKVSRSAIRQAKALQIYNDILRRNSARKDVVRLRMNLKVEMAKFVSDPLRTNGADVDVEDLLKSSPDDGELLYLKGRCYEAEEDDTEAREKAVLEYRKAIDHNAPKKIEASERLAMLLRDQLGQPKEADEVIEKLVKDHPENYRVYLARGRYRLGLAARDQSKKSLKSDAKKDLETARQKAPKEAEVYLELAQAVANVSRSKDDRDEVKRILEDGKKNVPTAAAIYRELAKLEERAGKVDEAIKVLESGLESATDQDQLRWLLTETLAKHGDTVKLDLQIQELRKLGYPQLYTQFYTAWYYININNFVKARQLLLTLPRAALSSNPGFNARVNALLARCHSQLNEPEMEQAALLRALNANPQDVDTHLRLAANMVHQGDTEGAINEYRKLVDRVPGVRLRLAHLLIEQNQRLPEPQRKWDEVTELIKQAAEASPESVDPVVFRAELLFTQGDHAAAYAELEKARTRFPKRAVEIRIAQANFLGRQRKVTEALDLIGRVQKELGDSVELRLERARLLASQKGPQVVKDLDDLAKDVERFSKPERKKLLDGLAAIELVLQQNPEEASRLWTQLAEEDPNNLELRLRLVDLALQIGNKDEIEKNIKQIKVIEGNDGLQGLYWQVRYLLWQATRADDKAAKKAIHLQARAILSELLTRRGDWSVIPLALANLEEQELKDLENVLKQSSVEEEKIKVKEEIKAKEEIAIGFYLQAIHLGKRDSKIVSRAVELLHKNGRSNDALDLIANDRESQLAIAVENRDFERVEQIARKAVDAKPDDFSARLWLARILWESKRQDEAGKELRKAVDLSPSDPVRWITLTKFLVLIAKRPQEAEKVIQEAEANLPSSVKPMAMAECCEIMGRAYDGASEPNAKKWYGAVRKWYEQAQTAHPADRSIKRRLIEFLLQSNQMDEAMALFEPDGKPATAGQEGKTLHDPDDLRFLVAILNLKKAPVHRKRAIEILENLAGKNLASSEDRFQLAQLYDATGDWPKARLKYDELDVKARNARDPETYNRRPFYLAQYAASLLQHRKPNDNEDLNKAQVLVDDIKALQPNALGTVLLQVEIHRARNQIDQAVTLIRAFTAQPNLTPEVLETLAKLAERMEQIDLAEELYRRQATVSGTVSGKLSLAVFLGRHERTKDALDICEPLWTNLREVERVASTCIDILFGSDLHTPDPAQVNRVADWFERALAPSSQQRANPSLFVGLGTLYDRQENYQKATELYERAIKEGERGRISSNNLGWLTVYNNLAWLTVLKYGKVKEALAYANVAISGKPENAEFLDTRGIVHLKAGDLQLALDDLLKAIAIDPSSPFKYFHLAQIQLAKNEKEKARQSWMVAKTKGFKPSGLHALEQQNYQELLNQLEPP